MVHTHDAERSEASFDEHQCVAVIDTETATSNPASACSVGWSFARRLNGEWCAELGGSVLVRPPRNIYAPRNIEVHGITPEETAEAACLMDEWETSIRPTLIASGVRWLSAYNAAFDAAVLWSSLAGNAARAKRRAWSVRAALRDPAGDLWRLGCLLATARRHIPDDESGSGYKLSDLCGRLGIEVSEWHEASNDSFAAAQVLCWILNRSDLGMPMLVDEAYGAWFRFGRAGPEPENHLARTERRLGILDGVTSDGRVHQRSP